eukprot:GILI01021306.1.p1 GENE.GILI01021306.1~~GILI01021306.1.p1  ORF type:complete len:122 (-),score=21.29 GILI01021306.1:110-475(-)
MRSLVLAIAFLLMVVARADTSNDTTTTAPTTTTTTTTVTGAPVTTTGTTGAPQPTPSDNPLNDGKKFGISTLVYVCILVAWVIFLFSYSKIVDHCACCQKKNPDSQGQKYATTSAPAPQPM